MKYIIKCSYLSKAWYYHSYFIYDENNGCWENSLSYAKHMDLIRARIIIRSITTNNYWINIKNSELKFEIINVK